MAKHKQHDLTDLADGLEHIVYEMWKYRQSVAYYEPIAAVCRDAAIEFRVLHHRVLLEFFYDRKPKHEDSIFAWEYIADWDRTHDRTKLPWLDSYMIRCHTMLAHVSKARSDMAKTGLKSWGTVWPIVESHLDSVIPDFLKGLSEGHKIICRKWVNEWLNGPYAGRDVLKALAAYLS